MSVDGASYRKLVARLNAEAARRGGKVAVERVDGHWRAGFVVRDDLGENVILLEVSGPDRDSALRRLTELAADQPR